MSVIYFRYSKVSNQLDVLSNEEDHREVASKYGVIATF
jgi:hypothetical protein